MNRCDRVDLRHAFDLPARYAPADPAPDPDEPRDPSSPPAGQNTPPDTAGGEGQGNNDDENERDGEAPDNPELKRLHDEAARYRVRAKAAEDTVASLSDQVRTLTLRMAFNDAANTANISDTEAAWKLASDELAVVNVGDDGTVDTDRIGQVTDHLVTRYPYLVASAPPTPEDQALKDRFPALAPSGRSTDRRRQHGRTGLDEQHLATKFPALRRR